MEQPVSAIHPANLPSTMAGAANPAPAADHSVSRKGGFLAGLLSSILVATTALASDPTAGWTVAGAFVDRARNMALELSRPPSAGEAEIMLVWLEAASRLDPQLAEAWLYQAELLELLQRPDQAQEVLTTYCRLEPADLRRRLSCLAGAFEHCQTAEERLQFCRAELERGDVPSPISGELHRWMAEVFQGIGDRTQAQHHARAAVEAFAYNFAAAELLEQLHPGPLPRSQQVKRLLLAACSAPHDPGPILALAQRLDDLSMHQHAWDWHQAAARLYPDGAPIDLLLAYAWSLRDGGDVGEAINVAERAIQRRPDAFDAHLALLQFARGAGRQELVDRELASLRGIIGRADTGGGEAGTAGNDLRAAWFFLEGQIDADKALEFSGRAHQARPNDPQVGLVHGLALVAGERHNDAVGILRPLAAGGNQWADWGLGRAWRESGKPEDAVKSLRDGERRRRSGLLYERIVQELASLGQDPLPMPGNSDIEAAMPADGPECLEFPFAPERFVQLSINLPNEAVTFGSPWVAEIALRNKGPLPITIGPGRMLEGELSLSATVTGPSSRYLGPVLRLPVDRVPVLDPGQEIRFTSTISRGALGRMARSHVQAELEVRLVATIAVPQSVQAGLEEVPSSPLRAETTIHRQRVPYDRPSLSALVSAIQQGDTSDRIHGYLSVAGLLAEATPGPSPTGKHEPARVDQAALGQMLVGGLGDTSVDVRVCVLLSMGHLQLTEALIRAAAEAMYDSDWQVRLAAVGLLASDQGKAFLPVVERLAQSDKDPWVRRLCLLHQQRLQSRMADR